MEIRGLRPVISAWLLISLLITAGLAREAFSAPARPDPQLIAQVQQVRASWEMLNGQAGKATYPTPADRTAINQEIQRAGQALQAADAAAQRGDRATVDAQLKQASQALTSASQRLSQLAQRPPQPPPSPPPSQPGPRPPAPAEGRIVNVQARVSADGVTLAARVQQTGTLYLGCSYRAAGRIIDRPAVHLDGSGEKTVDACPVRYAEVGLQPPAAGQPPVVVEATLVLWRQPPQGQAQPEISRWGWQVVAQIQPRANQPPVARIDASAAGQRAQEGQELRLTVPPGGEVAVALSGARSEDPERQLTQWEWAVDGRGAGVGREITRPFRAGTHAITVTVRDAQGATAQAQVRVVVTETVPPLSAKIVGVEPRADASTVTLTVHLQHTGPIYLSCEFRVGGQAVPRPAQRVEGSGEKRLSVCSVAYQELEKQRPAPGQSPLPIEGTVALWREQRGSELHRWQGRVGQLVARAGPSQPSPAVPSPQPPPAPSPDPQLLAQVQQARVAWQQVNEQAGRAAYPTPADRAAVSQDLQRAGQALDAAAAAAQRGDRATVQAQLGQAQQALTTVSQRLTQLAQRPPQTPPPSPTSPGPGAPPPTPGAPSPQPQPPVASPPSPGVSAPPIPPARPPSPPPSGPPAGVAPSVPMPTPVPPQNRPPVARIDASVGGQRVQEGQELRVTIRAGGEAAVTLSAARSVDPEGQALQYVWESGRQVLGTGREVIRPFRLGTHEVTLTVRDAQGGTAQTQVRVVVSEAAPTDQPPTAPTPPALIAPQITVGSTTVTPGGFIQISGSGFTPQGSVTIQLRPSSGAAVPPVQVRADQQGRIATQYEVPPGIPSGVYTLSAIDDRSRVSGNTVTLSAQAAGSPSVPPSPFVLQPPGSVEPASVQIDASALRRNVTQGQVLDVFVPSGVRVEVVLSAQRSVPPFGRRWEHNWEVDGKSVGQDPTIRHSFSGGLHRVMLRATEASLTQTSTPITTSPTSRVAELTVNVHWNPNQNCPGRIGSTCGPGGWAEEVLDASRVHIETRATNCRDGRCTFTIKSKASVGAIKHDACCVETKGNGYYCPPKKDTSVVLCKDSFRQAVADVQTEQFWDYTWTYSPEDTDRSKQRPEARRGIFVVRESDKYFCSSKGFTGLRRPISLYLVPLFGLSTKDLPFLYAFMCQ